MQDDQITEVIYTERSDTKDVIDGIDVCGGSFIDTKINSQYDVIFGHKLETLKLKYRSTIDRDHCVVSFGISAIKVHIIWLIEEYKSIVTIDI